MTVEADVLGARQVRGRPIAAKAVGGLRVRRIALGILRPIATFLPVFLIGTFITFLLGALTGLSPAYVQLGEAATPSAVARLNHQWGLDKPFLVRYWEWFSALLHGSLGNSWFDGVPVSELIGQRILISLSVAALALVLGVVFGTLFGTISALKSTSVIDRTITGFLSLISVMPPFTVGILLVAVFAVGLNVLPSAGYIPLSQGFGPWFSHIILPAIALSFEPVAALARQLRAGLVSAYNENYVLGSIVHGLSPDEFSLCTCSGTVPVPLWPCSA